MRFTLQREVLLKPLQQVVNVVERRQTLPVLANLLVAVSEDRLSLTATDLEMWMECSLPARLQASLDDTGEPEGFTAPARVFTEMVDFLIHGVGHRSVD